MTVSPAWRSSDPLHCHQFTRDFLRQLLLLALLGWISLGYASTQSFIRAQWEAYPFGSVDEITLRTYPHYACFLEASRENEIPVELLLAVAYWESRFGAKRTHRNKNGSTDIGVMQINFPVTARELGFQHVEELLDPCNNINAGARYLSQLMRRYDADVFLTLCAYNYGPGRIRIGSAVPEKAAAYAAGVFDKIQRISRTTYETVGVSRELIAYEYYFYANYFVQRIRHEDPSIPVEVAKSGRGPDLKFLVCLNCESDTKCTEFLRKIEEITGFPFDTGQSCVGGSE